MQLHASFCKAIWLCRGPEPAMHNVYCVTTACSPSCVYCTFLGGMLFKARNWIYSTAVLTNVPNLGVIMIGPAVTWALNLIKSVNGLAGGLISYYRDKAAWCVCNFEIILLLWLLKRFWMLASLGLQFLLLLLLYSLRQISMFFTSTDGVTTSAMALATLVGD